MRTMIVQGAPRISGRCLGQTEAAREHRASPQLELREALAGPPKIKGYAAVFNQLSERIMSFRERIIPGAFARSLSSNDDIRALNGHQTSQVLGRKKNGTLTLKEDNHGLFAEIVPPDTTAGRDVVENIKRGDIDGMSIGFITVVDRWKTENKQAIRELVEADLIEVSTVVFPAYTGTSVVVRQAGLSAARELLEELERNFGCLRTQAVSVQCRNRGETIEYLDRPIQEAAPDVLKEAGVLEVTRNFRSGELTIRHSDGRTETRSLPTSARTVPRSQPQQEKTPKERLLELESKFGINRTMQQPKREAEARKTPREILESLERRYNLKPSTVEALSDSELALYANPVIRKPDDYDERLSERHRQEFLAQKAEVANLTKRWAAVKRARMDVTYIAQSEDN